MNTAKAKQLVAILALMVLHGSMFISEAVAQAPPPSSNPPGAPIDIFAGFLLMGGVWYGMKKLDD